MKAVTIVILLLILIVSVVFVIMYLLGQSAIVTYKQITPFVIMHDKSSINAIVDECGDSYPVSQTARNDANLTYCKETKTVCEVKIITFGDVSYIHDSWILMRNISLCGV